MLRGRHATPRRLAPRSLGRRVAPEPAEPLSRLTLARSPRGWAGAGLAARRSARAPADRGGDRSCTARGQTPPARRGPRDDAGRAAPPRSGRAPPPACRIGRTRAVRASGKRSACRFPGGGAPRPGRAGPAPSSTVGYGRTDVAVRLQPPRCRPRAGVSPAATLDARGAAGFDRGGPACPAPGSRPPNETRKQTARHPRRVGPARRREPPHRLRRRVVRQKTSWCASGGGSSGRAAPGRSPTQRPRPLVHAGLVLSFDPANASARRWPRCPLHISTLAPRRPTRPTSTASAGGIGSACA